MIQLTPHMRIILAVEPADFRKGIDGLSQISKSVLKSDPFAYCREHLFGRDRKCIWAIRDGVL